MNIQELIMRESIHTSIKKLPFFVWVSTHNLSRQEMVEDDVFESLYQQFLVNLKFEDFPKFRTWCWEQFVHYYECSP